MQTNKFIIPKTSQTPQVEMDLAKGTFFMHGKIIPENPFEFFDQLNQGLEKYLKENPDNLEINMQLEYFNTVSSKLLSKFFQKVVSSSKPTLNWYYEKDDIELKEAGEDYSTIINYPINLIELEEEEG
ncbi:MAG: DUF1987 domain-containing protein [Bacteroidia bacterium]